MSLMRGKLFAGALFAGALLGGVATQQIEHPAGSVGSYSERTQKYQQPRSIEKSVKVDQQKLAMISAQHAEDEIVLHLVMNILIRELL